MKESAARAVPGTPTNANVSTVAQATTAKRHSIRVRPLLVRTAPFALPVPLGTPSNASASTVGLVTYATTHLICAIQTPVRTEGPAASEPHGANSSATVSMDTAETLVRLLLPIRVLVTRARMAENAQVVITTTGICSSARARMDLLVTRAIYHLRPATATLAVRMENVPWSQAPERTRAFVPADGTGTRANIRQISAIQIRV